MHNAVGIDIKGNFDLGHAARSRSDAIQVEGTQALVVAGKLTFALQNVDFNAGLVVSSSGEDLALLGGDGGVALNDLGANAAQSLNAQAQRGNIQQQQTLNVALQNTALDGSADSNTFIGVDALERLAVQFLLDSVIDSGDTGGATDHQDLSQVRSLQACISQSLADRGHGAVNQISGQFIELCAGQGHIQVLGAVGVSGDERQVDVGGSGAGQLDLCLFSSFLQALCSHLILAQVDVVFLLEIFSHPVDDALVEVIAAQVGITIGSQNFSNAIAHLDDGNIERTTAQVVNHDLLVGFLINAVSQRSCGRLVDDTLYVQTSNGTGVLGCLTLAVVEVSGNGDDSLGNGLAQVSFGISLQLCQDHSADLFGGVILAAGVNLLGSAHLTLDGGDGVFGVGDSLTLCNLAYQTLAGFGKADNRRGGTGTLSVRDNNGLAALHNSYAAVGSTKVNTNNLTHNIKLLSYSSFRKHGNVNVLIYI